MHLRQSIRFKGYWLSLLAWAIVSFGSSAASALDTTEAYWFRLCSVSNVSLQQADATDNRGPAPNCVCLSHTIVADSYAVDRPIFTPHLACAARTLGAQTFAQHHPAQPRAPPIIL